MIPMGFLFWIVLILSFLFSAWGLRGPDGKWNYVGLGGSFVLYLLLFLLGWRVFGFPIGR